MCVLRRVLQTALRSEYRSDFEPPLEPQEELRLYSPKRVEHLSSALGRTLRIVRQLPSKDGKPYCH
ncbi:hypothetical protein SAM_0224 [Streptococcus agalactiae CJB111]|nr:hypothetical protein SAM_0224 [Streptococcus agalactiae CJB111]